MVVECVQDISTAFFTFDQINSGRKSNSKQLLQLKAFFDSLRTEKSHYNPKNPTDYFCDFVKLSQAFRAYQQWTQLDGRLLQTKCNCLSGSAQQEAKRELEIHQKEFRQEDTTYQEFNIVLSVVDLVSSLGSEVFKRDIDLVSIVIAL